jgi:hypothetical protein
MGININGTLNINNVAGTNIGREYMAFATYAVTLPFELLQINTTGSLSGITFTPAANNITVPVGHENDVRYTVYTGTAPTINNVLITLTLNKGTLDTTNNAGNVYYKKNGANQSLLTLSTGADIYTFSVTTNENDSVEFLVSSYND